MIVVQSNGTQLGKIEAKLRSSMDEAIEPLPYTFCLVIILTLE